jgi:nucleoid-associated protein YgaU
MHHDQKVGLAMGILLTGVIASLFFRHQPELPAVAQAAVGDELDELIAARDNRPYPDQRAAAEPGNEVVSPAPAPPMATTGEPLASIGESGALLATSKSPDEAGPTVSPANQAASPTVIASRLPPSPEMREHEVRRGETLSAVASRYLGSPHRYEEIYLLNRDVLSSPDNVPEGVKLKVPAIPSRSMERIAIQPDRNSAGTRR